MRVALVDDHPLFVSGLRALLEDQPGYEVVAIARDAQECYAAVDTKRPDVLVLDIRLPGVDGVSAAREVLKRPSPPRVLMLTMFEDRRVAAEALAAGASGYAFKTQPAEEIVEAMGVVARGGIYLPPPLVDLTAERRPSESQIGEPLAMLSRRERDVFALLVRGFSNQGVADELGISIKTVETHRAQIHRKLGVHSVAQLIRFAALNDLLQP